MSSLSGSATRLGPGAADYLDTIEGDLKPFWTIADFMNEKEVLKWTQTAVSICESFYKDLFSIQQDNVLIYKGVQWLAQERSTNRFLDRNGVVTRKSPKVVINHLADIVEQWVSRYTQYPPAVLINPTNDEWSDKEDARISTYVLDHIWYESVMEEKLQKYARMLKVAGEAFLFVEWDPTKGDVHPAYIAAKQRGARVPITGFDGQPVKGTDGKPLFIDKVVRVGDVKYSLDAPWHVFEQPCTNRENIDWAIRWRAQDVDYLKAKFPLQADKIKAGSSSDFNSIYRLDMGRIKNQVIEYEFWHRSTEFLDSGRYMRFTKDALLFSDKLPYSHGELPYQYLCDIEVPDEIRGMSFFQQLFPLQFQINAAASLIYKALVLFAHPKIVMPEGACQITQLANDNTIVTYRGGVPPTLMNSPAIPQEGFALINKFEQTLEKLSGIFSLSRGQAPSGVRAAKALRVIDEQEDKRGNAAAVAWNRVAIVGNAKKTISVAGDFYDDSDGRLVRVVGKNNQYLIRNFKKSNLSKAFDIRVERTTALSKSPAARIQEVIEIQNVRFDPNSTFTREEFLNALDFYNSDELKDVATRAVMCAQSENDDLMGENFQLVQEPTSDEDLIMHWKIHMRVPQSRDFKDFIPPPNKAAFLDHMMATEYLMFKKAFGDQALGGAPNPAFAQKMLMLCPEFPIYFTPQPPPTLPMAAPGMAPGDPSGMAAGGEIGGTAGPVADPVMQGEQEPSQTPVEQGGPTMTGEMAQ